MYFVFKPENFVKTNGFFVYSEKGFVPLVTMCFVKKNVLQMKHKLFICVKDKLVSFYKYWCLWWCWVEKNGFKRLSVLYIHIYFSHLLYFMLTHRTYICPLHYALLPYYPPLKTCGCCWSSSSCQRPLVKIDAPFSDMTIIFLINTLAI